MTTDAPRPLTPRQHELIGFLRSYHASHGYMPTIHEMQARMGLKSSSGPARLLEGLEAKNWIRRTRWRVRAIEFLRPVGNSE